MLVVLPGCGGSKKLVQFYDASSALNTTYHAALLHARYFTCLYHFLTTLHPTFFGRVRRCGTLHGTIHTYTSHRCSAITVCIYCPPPNMLPMVAADSGARRLPPAASFSQYSAHFFLVHFELHIIHCTMSEPPQAQSHMSEQSNI